MVQHPVARPSGAATELLTTVFDDVPLELQALVERLRNPAQSLQRHNAPRPQQRLDLREQLCIKGALDARLHYLHCSKHTYDISG